MSRKVSEFCHLNPDTLAAVDPDLREQVEQLHHQFHSEVDRYETQLAEVRQRAESLQAEVVAARVVKFEAETLKLELAKEKSELATKKLAQLQALQEKNDELTKRIRELEKLLAKERGLAQQQEEKLTADSAKRIAELTQRQERITSDQSKRLAEMQSSLDQQIKYAQAVESPLRQTIQNLKSKLASAAKQGNESRHQIEQNVRSKYEQQIQELRGRLEHDLSKERDLHSQTSNKFKEVTQRLAALTEECDGYKRDLSSLKDTQQQLELLKTELKQSRQANLQLDRTLQKERGHRAAERKTSTQDHERLQQSLKSLQTKLSTETGERGRAQQRIQLLQTQLGTVEKARNAEHEQHSLQLTELHTRIAGLEQALEQAKRACNAPPALLGWFQQISPSAAASDANARSFKKVIGSGHSIFTSSSNGSPGSRSSLSASSKDDSLGSAQSVTALLDAPDTEAETAASSSEFV